MSESYLDKTGLTYLWSKLKSYFVKGNTGGVFYGTSSTAAATTTKDVVCADFTADDLKAGTIIVVSFTTTNSGAVASLKLDVNDTGAKPIKYINNGTLGNLSSAGYLKANTEYPFYYDGANWVAWFNYNSSYSAMSEAEMKTGTATTGRSITAQRLKQAVQYHAPVTSVNGDTGDVTVFVPTKTSDLTNDSGFLTSAPVTSVNGSTGDVTVSVPTKTSDLTNDSGYITDAGVTSFNGSTGAVTYTAPVTSVNGSTGAVTVSVPTTVAELSDSSNYVQVVFLDDYLGPKFHATDATSQAVLNQISGTTPQIYTPKDLMSFGFITFACSMNPRWFFGWMNGTELEVARLGASVDTASYTITVYLRGRTSIATGKIYMLDIENSDTTWTVTPLASDAEGVAY